MEFFTRVLSGSSSRVKERAREAEQVNQAFKENLDNLKRLLESEESNDVLTLLDMVYESSFPEEQVFMKTPSRARLKSKKELVVRLLIGLDSLGVPAMAELLAFIRKHGPEGVADSLLNLLESISPLLEGKEAPEFSTDDVVDAMDFEWHSTSRTGSPLLNVIASAASSPRASTASIGESPLHPGISASPYRRAISDRSMLVSRTNELGAKSVRDKTYTTSTPPQRSFTVSASLQHPSANQDFRSGELTILKTPASPEITPVSIVENSSSYSLDTLPESGIQRKHRRKSSSLQQLLVEDSIAELSREGSASSRRNSSSSSWQRNSLELKKIMKNTSETSSPMNPGFAAGDGREGVTIAPDKTLLSSIYTQDGHVNRSSRKGSPHILPSPPPDDEVQALWREDSGGFSVDLVSSDKSVAQTSVDDAEHGTPLILHNLEAEVCPSAADNDALKVHELELRLRSHVTDEDDAEDARPVLSSHDHEDDAGRAHLSSGDYDQDTEHADSLNTHEEDAGPTHTHVQSSSDNHMEDVQSSHNPDEEARPGHSQAEEDAAHAHDHEQDTEHAHSLDTHEEDAAGSAQYTHAPSSSDNHMEDVHSSHNPDEEAKHGHSQAEEDAVHAHDHGKDARHTYSLDTCEEDAGYTHMVDLEQDGCDTTSNKITPKNSSQEGYGFHGILTPLLLSSSSNVSPNVNDQAGDISSFSLENDMDVNSMEGSSYDGEREDKELHTALSPCEDLQSTQEAGDVNPSSPIQDQGQVNIQYGAHRGVPVQSCETDITDDIPLSVTHGVHGMINNEDRGHLLSKFSNDAATLSHADAIASPTNGVTVSNSNELLDDQHPYHQVEADEHLQKLPSLDALSMKTTALTDCADHSNSTYQAPPFLKLSPTLGEACLEESLQSGDGQSMKQEALGMKDDTSPGEEVNAHTSSRDEVVNTSLDTDSVNHSLNEYIKPEMPEMMREVEKKEDVEPLGVHVSSVSNAAVGPLNVNDDQFEKLLSDIDAAEEDVLCDGGVKPLISNTEGEQMGMHDNKLEEITQEEDPARARASEKEKIQLQDEKMGIVDENTLSKESSESTPFVHAYPVESHAVTSPECGGSKEASMVIHKPCLEEILQSKDGQSLKQEALGMKDDTFAGEEANAHTSSINVEVNSSLNTDSVNQSLNENIKLEMPEMMSEDGNIQNAQPLDVHCDNVSRPCASAEHLKVNDDQFERLLSELDATEEDVRHEGGDLPLINNSEGGQMGMHDNKLEENTEEEDPARARALDKEKVQLHDVKMGIVDENTLSKGRSGKEFLDNTGHFIMGGPRHIPALVEFDDANHMQDHCQGHQEHPSNLEDLEPSFEQGVQEDTKGVHDVVSDTTSAGESTPFVPVYPVASHVVGGQMGMHDDKMEDKTQEEDPARELDKEKMQLHNEKILIINENSLSKENSEKELLDNTGQFIMGGPRHIPALVECDDCTHMQDHWQAHQASPDLQDVEPTFEQGMLQDLKGVHEVDFDDVSEDETPFMHVYPLESHVVAATEECGGSKEASMVCETANSKLDQDKQSGLECPTMVEEALQEGEVSKPCLEASEVVDVSSSHPLHDRDHIPYRSLGQISDAGSAALSTKSEDIDQVVQSTKPRDIDELAVEFTASGTQCQLLTQVVEASDQSRPLHDVNDYTQRRTAHFTEPYTESPSRISDYESASRSTKCGSAAQSADTELVGQFTGSGLPYEPSTQVTDASESRPLHEDDYIQQPAEHFTEPYAGSFTAVTAANGDMRAGLMASFEDNHVSHEYVHLHDHPTSSSTLSRVDSQQQSDHEALTYTNVPKSKRKGSCVGKLTRGCLSCCTKPHTNA